MVMRSIIGRRHKSRALLIALGMGGCVFPFDRTAVVGDGELRLTPRRADGSLAASAVAAVSGSARVTAVRSGVTDTDDAMVLPGLVAGTWLVKLSEDDDGDGAAERGVWLAERLDLVAYAKSLNEGCGGERLPQRVNTKILGEVLLEDAASLDVTVQVDDGSGPRALLDEESARVAVWRDLRLGEQSYSTSVEASATVANGAARMAGILPGAVHVAVFVSDSPGGTDRPTWYGVVELALEPGASQTASVVAALPARAGDGPRTHSANIELQWDVGVADDADITDLDVLLPEPNTGSTVPQTLNFRQLASGDAIAVELPVGISNLVLTTSTGGLVNGELRGVVVAPGAQPTATLLGPVELPRLADPCAPLEPGAPRDCDHDTIPDDEDDDRDGDGQRDADEGDQRCVGPGLGTDIDGDGLCEPVEDAVDGT